MNSDSQNSRRSLLALAASMVIFGTVPLMLRYILLSSPVIAFARSLLGASFLLLIMLITRQRFASAYLRKNCGRIMISGILLGINWIALFESFNYTTVAVATLCDNLAPVFVVLVSPIIFKEKLTKTKLLCVAASAVGILLVSGKIGGNVTGSPRGIIFALCSAILYALVIILGKTIVGVPAHSRTVLQLATCSLALLPYVLLTEKTGTVQIGRLGLAMLVVLGLLHTGVAYALYFGSMDGIKAQTFALMSYIGPCVTLFVSAVVLKEPMTLPQAIGAVFIFSAVFFSNKE
ncbi:MAG: DMT family transporter [Clostridiales bacterium]|nr:DMT family transporter [Clostridiales bacterium]